MKQYENKVVKPRKPRGLAEAGEELWDSVADRYSLRPDEVRMLVDACKEADIVARLETELADAPLMVKGSMGQLVASPLVTEVRQHRAAVAMLLGKLKLPDNPQDDARKRAVVSENARKAARARWGSGGQTA